MVRKIGLADDEQAGDIRHQVVIHPQTAHRVMRGRVDLHRSPVRVFVADVPVHVEQVAIALFDKVQAMFLDGALKIQIDTVFHRADASPFVAGLLNRTRRDVPWRQVAIGRVLTLQEIIAFRLRYVARFTRVIGLLWHPHTPVIAQRFRHQRQLGLVLVQNRDTGRMDLCETGIGKQRAALVGAVYGGDITTEGIG